jgi:hypothetical protein
MTCYDDYPVRIVVLSLAEVLAALALGLVLVAQLGWRALLAFAVVGCLGLALSLAYGCTRCHYYGRVCGLGLGKIASVFFRQRNQADFGRTLSQTVAWSLLGLTMALPLAAGLVSLAKGSGLTGLLPLGVFLALVFAIALTHSRYICGHCRQARDGVCTLSRMAGRS